MKTVKELAKEYYPKLWDGRRIQQLVQAGRLSEEDAREITGEEV